MTRRPRVYPTPTNELRAALNNLKENHRTLTKNVARIKQMEEYRLFARPLHLARATVAEDGADEDAGRGIRQDHIGTIRVALARPEFRPR